MKQAHEELMQTDALQGLIRETAVEYENDFPAELSVEEWTREFEQIHRELNEYLAR